MEEQHRVRSGTRELQGGRKLTSIDDVHCNVELRIVENFDCVILEVRKKMKIVRPREEVAGLGFIGVE